MYDENCSLPESKREEFMPGSRVHECVASEASLNYECITIIFMVFIRWWCEVNQNFPSTDPRLWMSVKWCRKILMCIANASSQISYPFTLFFRFHACKREKQNRLICISKIKYVKIIYYLLLVNAWYGRTIVKRDETQFDSKETHSLVNCTMHVIHVAVHRRCYNICFWQHQTSSKIQIMQTKVAIINFSFWVLPRKQAIWN